MSRVSIGVAGMLGPEAIGRIARAVEDAGFHALWVNDAPGGDSLAALSVAAVRTESLVLATGVVPLDRRPPAEILRAARALPADRLVLGVGSGGTRTGALALVRDGVAELRAGTDARILVGALGPRMRALAASVADGPLLSWLTPEIAAEQSAEAHASAPETHVALYVRTALDAAATTRLDAECRRYGTVPNYVANFERLGIHADDAVIRPDAPHELLDRYRAAVDEVVLRAITPDDDVDAYLRFVEEAARRFLS